MITASDSCNTVDMGEYFAILPMAGNYSHDEYCDRNGCKPVEPGFAYNSGTNPDFLGVERIRKLIQEHLDPKFAV